MFSIHLLLSSAGCAKQYEKKLTFAKRQRRDESSWAWTERMCLPVQLQVCVFANKCRLTRSKIFGGSKSFRAGQQATCRSYAHERPQRAGTFIQPLMSARCTLSSACNVCGIDTIKVRPWQNDESIHKSFLALFSLSSRGEKKESRLQVYAVMDVGSKSWVTQSAITLCNCILCLRLSLWYQ